LSYQGMNMAKQSWHDKPTDIETDAGMARTGSPKRLDPLVLHPAHASRTSTSLGAPPTGASSDASSPLPTDFEKQHGSKTLPIPAQHPGMKASGDGSKYDPALADAVMGGASRPAADFAPLLHTLPATTKEN
jgi:hypothetical protein